MSTRLAFQTQLASIMEVLANAAVAEICKLVDDDYAVVSLQMSQCQRENKALKRKLHLLELKMARGAAERRLRDSATNSSRPRVQIRESSSSTGGAFERQMDMSLWTGGAAVGDVTDQPVCSDDVQCKSPDVQLVEPEQLLVKEESMETNKVEETEEDVTLIGDDGVLEQVHCGASGQRVGLQEQNTQSQTGRTRPPARSSGSSRGVERVEEPDVVLVKVEDVEPVTATGDMMGLSIQEGLVESSTDDYRGALAVDETTPAPFNQLSELQESGGGFSESAAAMSEDSSSMAVVQLRVPDTNTPANPNAGQQQQQQQQQPAQRSEYSLFELETFFTRWAPDNDSTAPPAPPSFSNDDSADCDPDGVTIVETEPQGSSAGAMGVSCAATRTTAHVQPTESQAGASSSVTLRMQVPSSRCPWSKKQQQQQQQQRGHPSALSASTNSSSDKPNTSAVSSVCRILTPQSSLPVRGPPTSMANITAQHRAALLGHHNESQMASIALNERRRKNYVCRACGKGFPGLSNLEAHERVHTGEKPFRCSTCGKHFSEAGNLKKHQRVHTGEKPFSCNQCGKRFAWICNLRTHQQSATGCGPQIRGGLGLS